MSAVKTVAILGGGSFGTVIANLVADNGHRALLWLRNAERAEQINQYHVNAAYLDGFELNPDLKAVTDLNEAVADADFVFVAVPSKSSREVARQLAAVIRPETYVISTTKGIEAEGFKLMSQVLQEELKASALGVLSGPNLAKEIAERQITASVIASQDESLVKAVQDLLGCHYFRVYAGNDMYGVELGGALKNIYAIMCGLGAALELGQNTMGLLLTRSLAEMSRFAVRLGANPMTFLGLSGVGDLIVTCMSPLSRNYRVGYELGKGKNLEQIINDLGQVAEGLNTLELVKQKADELDIYMPLVFGMHEIVYQQKDALEVAGRLMSGQQSTDVEFAQS